MDSECDDGWDLGKIDIYKCARIWGLEEPIEYTTQETIHGPADRCNGRYMYLNTAAALGIDMLTDGVAIWLNPKLVGEGRIICRRTGKKYYALITYAHEVAHALTQNPGQGDNDGHDIEFAAVFAFLLLRIPSKRSVSDFITDYDVHQTIQMTTPFRRGSKAENWKKKAREYAKGIALDWGWALAQDQNMTAPRAAKIIKKWDQERRAEIYRKEQIEDRLTIWGACLAILAAACWWIWQMSRPLI